MPSRAKRQLEEQGQGFQLPDFNSDALESLSRKIASNLKQPDNGTTSKIPQATPKTSKVKKGVMDGGFSRKNEAPNSGAMVRSNAKSSSKMPEQATTTRSGQGKKRSRDGRAKETWSIQNGDNVNKIKLGPGEENYAAGGKNNIEEDVKALGGTKEDMELFADVLSDSEMEGDSSRPNEESGDDLRKELQRLVRQLGVDTAARKELSYPWDSDEVDETQHIEAKAQNGKATKLPEAHGQKSDVPKKNRTSLAFPPHSEWHAAPLPPLPASSSGADALPHDLLDRIHKYAKSLLDSDNKQYAAHNAYTSSAHQFYSTIMSTGTLSDKISALTLSVQESPVHNLKALESLVGLARKRSRGQAVEVLGALKDLFGPGNLLPSGRKLRTFASQPLLSTAFTLTDYQWTSEDPLPKPLGESHLISWAYEDWLKSTFFEVLKIIETWCSDEVVFARGKAVDYVCQLLKEKPEQEANLLRLLVNKLGDSDKKIASKTSFNILQLETTHPLMKPIIISAIESDILFRPGQSLHAKYYATITLNQTVLSTREEGVARKLLDIYFSLFIKLLEKPKPAKASAVGGNSSIINRKGEVQGGGGPAGKKAQKTLAETEKATTVDEDLRDKMLSAVLTGVNRAIPFLNTNEEAFEKHLNTLFTVTHSSNFNTSIQALILIEQLNGTHQGSADRFYRTLYESLLDPRLLKSSKQALYLNLLFRALKSDLNVKRVQAFAKRLLQVVAMHQPSFTCGTLYLLRELESVFPALSTFIDQHTDASDDEEESFHDIQETEDFPRSSPRLSRHNSKPTYDGRKRDPSHAYASTSSLWELTLFLTHYHPSVSLFATRLLNHAPMPPKPDLALNTLIHFLDRFVYRNPKITSTAKGASIMQGGDSSALLVTKYSEREKGRAPVNSEGFRKLDSDKVGADEVFFHKYFNTVGTGREKARKKKEARRKEGGGSESEGDEEIWKALVESRPEVEGGSDGGIFSDEDIDMEVLEDEEEDENQIGDKAFNEGEDGLGDQDDRGILDDDFLNLGDEEDDAIFDSEAEVPSDLEEAAFYKELESNKKKTAEERTSEEGAKSSKKRRRLKNLPTFASAEDYARMLGNEDDDQ